MIVESLRLLNEAMMKANEEEETAKRELAEANALAESNANALSDEAAKNGALLDWSKTQRQGLGNRFEHNLDAWLQARVFDALKRYLLTVRFNRLAQEVKQRVQTASDAADQATRRCSRAQEDAQKYQDEADRLRRELRELQARLSEVEKLKEVDIKLEIMARERKIRDLLDQRSESLPPMPDSPHGMMGGFGPSPPNGDPTGWHPGSGRSLPRGNSTEPRPMSTGTRLPPTNHYSRAAEQCRADGGRDVITGITAPVRPHTSMDGVSHHSEYHQSRSPEGSRQRDRSPQQRGNHIPVAPRSARQNPRGPRQRRVPNRSVSNRRHVNPGQPGPADVGSDMWAFVNFGTPMTDYVMNTEMPMPKTLRRLVGREGEPES